MGVPEVLGSSEELFAKVMTLYDGFVDYARTRHAPLWKPGLTLNTAGSPSYRMHENERTSTEVSVGSALVKPTHYDLPSLVDHQPAAFIATPVLKSTGPVRIPALDDKSALFSWWDANQRETFFVYGGNWMAEPESPRGLQFNGLYGRSSNQEMVNGSSAVKPESGRPDVPAPDPVRVDPAAVRRPAGDTRGAHRRALAGLQLSGAALALGGRHGAVRPRQRGIARGRL